MNRREHLRIVILTFFLLCTLFLQPSLSFGQELPAGMVIGDDQGINAKKNGEYLVNVTDVMPGKKWHTTISMINMEKDIPYELSMLISKPTVSGSLDLSQAIQMTISYEGKIVYEGAASGINGQLNLQNKPLQLGTFKAGDSRALDVSYAISGEYTNKDFAKKNVMDNVWTFSAVKATNSTPNPSDTRDQSFQKPLGKFPNTGEAIRQGMIIICLGLFLILMFVLVWKKKQTNQNKPLN